MSHVLFPKNSLRHAGGPGYQLCRLEQSILAWIWLTLVPPLRPELTEPIPVDKKARRRSAPAALPSHKRHSTPSVASGEAQVPPDSPQRTRRVYFVDSPTASSSRPTNIQRTSNDSADLPLHSSPTSEISPSSSSSTLVHTYTAIAPQTLETCRESAIESDSSNSSPRPSLSLSRPFQKASRPRRSSTTSATLVPDIPPIITGPPADTKQRRSSGGLIPPWSFRRVSGPKNVASPTTATSSAAPGSSGTSSASPTTATVPSYFTRKTARRVSTPVPRTQPYAYPYYAQPPIEDEGYVAYLRNLPQFSSDTLARSPVTSSDSEEKEKEKEKEAAPQLDQRGRNRKANNDKAQAALGHGRRPPPQRSASESWAAGQDPRL